MNRAIVHFVWGERYLNELRQSIRWSVQATVPRILITDSRTAASLTSDRIFDDVISADIDGSSLRAKATFYKHVPAAYDTFLYLDTDATIVEDISYGFEQASTHGVAACMAPHYSLDYFWGFDQTLHIAGIPCMGQMQYNTGVLFIHRTRIVDSLFQKWEDLTFRLGGGANAASDQPFFTLALEMERFNPFTLSPSYNYRGLGELASGMIRVWHSHFPVPRDINSFGTSWPPRRFRNGAIVPY